MNCCAAQQNEGGTKNLLLSAVDSVKLPLVAMEGHLPSPQLYIEDGMEQAEVLALLVENRWDISHLELIYYEDKGLCLHL